MNLYNYYNGVFTFVKLLFINLNITFNVNDSVRNPEKPGKTRRHPIDYFGFISSAYV